MHTTAELSYPKSALFKKVVDWLNPFYSSYRDLHFWIIQGFIFTITVAHILADRHLILSGMQCSDFFPAALFFVPVIYGALRFGFAGSVVTAVEATILNTPGLVLFHNGSTILGLGIQFLFVITVATFLGYSVDRESMAKIRAKTYATLLTNAQEKERQRIARDLHDGSVQTMILLCRELEAVNNSPSLPMVSREKLQAAKRIAEQQIKALRNVTSDLRPPILDDLGVVAAIRRLQMDLMDRTGVHGELEVSGNERRLSSELELGLFRIAQEALSNVERHARATKVVVTIRFTNKEITLKVQDNGIGFTQPVNPKRATADGGLGILGMEERAELLNGKLEIQSSHEKGTLVTAVVPLYSEQFQYLAPAVVGQK